MRVWQYTLKKTILLLLCALVPFVAQQALAADAIGSVTSMDGEAYATKPGAKRDLDSGAHVFVEETLHTRPDSKLVVTFLDDTVLRMDENTSVELKEFSFDEKPGGFVNMVSKMLRGLVRMTTGKIVEKNRDNFSFETPLTTLGIRGTDFFAATTPQGEEIGVTEMSFGHIVALQSETDQTVIDKQGYYVKVSPDGRFSPLIRISKDVTRRIMRVQSSTIRKSIQQKPPRIRPGHP